MPSGITWAIGRVVIDVLNSVVKQCVWNQSRGYWLLSDAMFGVISIARKFEAKYVKKVEVMPPLSLWISGL